MKNTRRGKYKLYNVVKNGKVLNFLKKKSPFCKLRSFIVSYTDWLLHSASLKNEL